MANNPTDYRDPKVTAAPAKKSTASYLPWLLLALGLLFLLAWLFGAFDRDDDTTTRVSTPSTVNEQTTATPPANRTTPAN